MTLIRLIFNITVEGKLNNFLGCNIVRDPNNLICWLHQPHLIGKLKKNFGTNIIKVWCNQSLGSPRNVIQRIKEDDPEKLKPEVQTLYPSGVGSLLFLFKHSQPELSNPFRELSKAMGGANNSALTEMYKVIKWVLNTENLGLKMEPNIERDNLGNVIWRLRGISDSTWGSDPDDGRSVTRYIVYFMGVPISWKSKTQSHVTLSSSEAEYAGASELYKEILYVKQILNFIGIYPKLPIEVQVDNIGAIQMARNNIGGAGTRHVNYRYQFSRELQGSLIDLVFFTQKTMKQTY